ncbi:MAG: HPr family phosphocarrier protein [Desulfobacteraceae bacterium]|nr:MAG: HPr family phosphocarrier protein [Desulfobacteraceae bacterium]
MARDPNKVILENNSFEEKARFFSHEYLRCFLYLTSCDSSEQIFTKSLYSKLITTSHLLEDFLDFHGAKNNSKWYFYRELAAAVRHISLGGYAQKHINNRLKFYDIDNEGEFSQNGHVTLEFMTTSLMKLAPVIIEEARRLGIKLPDKGYKAQHFPVITTGDMLDHDFEDEQKDQYNKHVVRVANDFISLSNDFDAFEFVDVYDQEGLKALVPDRVNEVEIRRFEMRVHNLQSSFDSYVIHGGFLCGNRNMKRFRSYFSVIYHLLQVMGRLLHFYERHLIDIGYKYIYTKARERLAELVDPNVLLDCTVNYGLYYVNHFFSSGKEMAQEILKDNIERASITVGIPKDMGFHCRPSLMVAKIVQNYGGEVKLIAGGDLFDASSVLDIQWAGGKIQKENIQQVTFEGDIRALKDIETLAGVNYGEDQMGKGIPLPKSLQYLR